MAKVRSESLDGSSVGLIQVLQAAGEMHLFGGDAGERERAAEAGGGGGVFAEA